MNQCIFCQSHLAEILETQRLRSSRLHQSNIPRICSDRRLHRSWSLSTDSIFFPSHVTEILETGTVRSWRLKESNIPPNTPHSTPDNIARNIPHNILDTQIVRSCRLKESCGFPKVFVWCQVATNCLSQPPRPACQRSILHRKPVEPSRLHIHQVHLHLEWR